MEKNPGDDVGPKGSSPMSRIYKRAKIPFIEVKSSEGKIFCIKEEIACQCEALKHLIEDGCKDGIVPLPNVSTEILELVIEWCKKHTDSEMMKTMNNKKEEDKLKEWETKFVDVDMDTLYYLIMAANYLAHKELVHRLCEKAGSLISNKTPEEIREMFNIKNDYTPEEEEAVTAPFRWAFEKWMQ